MFALHATDCKSPALQKTFEKKKRKFTCRAIRGWDVSTRPETSSENVQDLQNVKLFVWRSYSSPRAPLEGTAPTALVEPQTAGGDPHQQTFLF